MPARAFGLRQDDHAADGGRVHGAQPRPHRSRWPRHHQRQAQPARIGHRVPELCAVSAHDRGRQRRLRPGDARRDVARAAQEGGRHARTGASLADGEPLSTGAVRRPAAARGPGACPCDSATGVAARRTNGGTGRQAAGGNADRVACAAAPRRHHDPHGHSRPGRGDDPGRSRGADEQGVHRAGGTPIRDVRKPERPFLFHVPGQGERD